MLYFAILDFQQAYYNAPATRKLKSGYVTLKGNSNQIMNSLANFRKSNIELVSLAYLSHPGGSA